MSLSRTASKCKYMDCVEVCPVDCFYEGDNMLVIHPDECIDCGVCEPECPAEAIKPDTEPESGFVAQAERGLRKIMAEHYVKAGAAGRCERDLTDVRTSSPTFFLQSPGRAIRQAHKRSR